MLRAIRTQICMHMLATLDRGHIKVKLVLCITLVYTFVFSKAKLVTITIEVCLSV